jgi:hypothetical protein
MSAIKPLLPAGDQLLTLENRLFSWFAHPARSPWQRLKSVIAPLRCSDGFLTPFQINRLGNYKTRLSKT